MKDVIQHTHHLGTLIRRMQGWINASIKEKSGLDAQNDIGECMDCRWGSGDYRLDFGDFCEEHPPQWGELILTDGIYDTMLLGIRFAFNASSFADIKDDPRWIKVGINGIEGSDLNFTVMGEYDPDINAEALSISANEITPMMDAVEARIIEIAKERIAINKEHASKEEKAHLDALEAITTIAVVNANYDTSTSNVSRKALDAVYSRAFDDSMKGIVTEIGTIMDTADEIDKENI